MKKWLKKKFSEWCKEAWYNEHGKVSLSSEYDAHIGHAIVGARHQKSIESSSINFTIYPAIGGHVLEMTINDYQPSQLQLQVRKVLHIIPNGEDLGNSLGKIITLEMLKQ